MLHRPQLQLLTCALPLKAARRGGPYRALFHPAAVPLHRRFELTLLGQPFDVTVGVNEMWSGGPAKIELRVHFASLVFCTAPISTVHIRRRDDTDIKEFGH